MKSGVKKSKKIKKLIIVLIVLAVLGGGSYAGVGAYQDYQTENTQTEVVAVSNLNWGYMGDDMTSSGYVSDDYAQSVYIEDKTVAEVKVAQGDEVKIGDPLLVYDTADIQLQIDMQKLELQGVKNDITLAQREVERLKKITPVTGSGSNSSASVKKITSSPTKKTPSNSVVILQMQQKDGDAYNYIDTKAKPYTGKGTIEEPYRFLCTQECYVLGSYLNRLASKEQVAAFEIWSGNSVTEGALMTCWTVNGMEQKTVSSNSKWMVATQEEIEEEIEEEEEETESEEPESESEENSTEEEYTAEELKQEIADKEGELKELAIDKKTAKLELKRLKKSLKAATVLASINGVVRLVGDPADPPTDGSAFLEVAGAEGMYVKGEISELMLDQIEIGQMISASSWSNGETYSATITEISEYPSENRDGYYGEGNPNVSYYSFLGYIENAEGLVNGDSLDLSITPVGTEEDMNALYIDKAYVRQENGRYYVLKADENNRLVKQYVQTGKTLYGSAIEIKGGLSESDRIAFPYGKNAKEGMKAVDSNE